MLQQLALYILKAALHQALGNLSCPMPLQRQQSPAAVQQQLLRRMQSRRFCCPTAHPPCPHHLMPRCHAVYMSKTCTRGLLIHGGRTDCLDAQYSPLWPKPTVLCHACSRQPSAGYMVYRPFATPTTSMWLATVCTMLRPWMPSCQHFGLALRIERSADDLQAAILPASSPPAATQLQAKQLQGASMTAAQLSASGAAIAAPAVTPAPPAIVPPPGAQQPGSWQRPACRLNDTTSCRSISASCHGSGSSQ